MYSIGKNDRTFAIVCDDTKEALNILESLGKPGPHYFKDGESVLKISNVRDVLITFQFKGEMKKNESSS